MRDVDLERIRMQSLYEAHYAPSPERLVDEVNFALATMPLYERLGYPRRIADSDAFAQLPVLAKATLVAARPSDLVSPSVIIADGVADGTLRRISSSGTRDAVSVWVTPDDGAFTPATNDIIMGISRELMSRVALLTSPQCSGGNCALPTDGTYVLLPPTPDVFAEPMRYIDSVAARLNDLGPVTLLTNPVLLHALARRAGDRLRFSGAVMSSYQRLNTPQRRGLARLLAAPVFEQYGATELAGATVTNTCRFGTAHVWESQVHVEVLSDDDTPCALGELGRIVVTTLAGEGTRLVRYDVGDLGRLVSVACACGLPRGHAVEVHGRRSAAWRVDDRWVTEAQLDDRLSGLEVIDFVQIIRTVGGLRVVVVPRHDTHVHPDDVRDALDEVVDVVIADRVAAVAGKYPFVRRWDT